MTGTTKIKKTMTFGSPTAKGEIINQQATRGINDISCGQISSLTIFRAKAYNEKLRPMANNSNTLIVLFQRNASEKVYVRGERFGTAR